ncbi:shikimate dehydrogenase family protein [Halobacteriovorax marinus]|uniref:shikimate dehydrogenase family protein n=1 Tax=Halobacteriovorax marinus TaxID=97084 RepID=UPI003A8D395F
MLKLALIGKGISHSKSQEMYEKILGRNIKYSLLDYEAAEKIPKLQSLFESIEGLSITSPYKEHFIKEVTLNKEVELLGAINCIARRGDKYFGTNTDYLAVESLIKKNFLKKNIVILGDGVMARVTIAVLKKLDIKFRQFSRKLDGDLNHISLEDENLLVINTCSRCFHFNNQLSDDAVFWDYNYSFPAHIEYFKGKRYEYIDGLEMLELQAKFALEFWNIPE